MLDSAFEVCKHLCKVLWCYGLSTNLGKVRLCVAKHEGVSKEDASFFRL